MSVRAGNQISDSRLKAGFTLVELLVVIGIIGLLVSILLPVVSRARQHAQNVLEIASLREVLIAYTAYASDNNGTLLAGHLPTTEKPALVDDRGVAIPSSIAPEIVQRWPWRLLVASKYDIKFSLFVGERKNRLWGDQIRTTSFWHYAVSLTPSFGLNMYNLGGDLRIDGSGNHSNDPNFARKINNVRNASGMIAFTSARGQVPEDDAPAGMISDEGGKVNGYWYVVAPERRIRHPISGVVNTTYWSPNPYSEADDGALWGNIHARLGGKVAVGYVDGHCDIRTIDELRDPNLWTNP